MNHLIFAFLFTVASLYVSAQQDQGRQWHRPGEEYVGQHVTHDTIPYGPQPSLYEWFFPEEPAVQVESSIGLKTKDSLVDKFRRKADRMAVRWMRKAEKSREDAAKLIGEADALMKKAQGLRSEAVLKEKEALWFEAEKAKILGIKFK